MARDRPHNEEPTYSFPDNFSNLDEVNDPPPVQNPNEDPTYIHNSNERSQGSRQQRSTDKPDGQDEQEYDIPDNYGHLDELAEPSPVQNPDEDHVYRYTSLEEAITNEHDEGRKREEAGRNKGPGRGYQLEEKDGKKEDAEVSRLATQVYTISYLVLFAILGTLARLGLQAVTFYPGAPIAFSELWANFGGSLFFGFLAEDRMLFREEWGSANYDREVQRAKRANREAESEGKVDLTAAKKAHGAVKKTIPLYIGLATGFCGSFTSFSSFIRDVFLALSNDSSTPLSHYGDTSTANVERNGGYSFMALLAVIIITVTSCMSAVKIGAHLAIFTEPYLPTVTFNFGRKILDRVTVFLAWGCWLGAIMLAIFPPDRFSENEEAWRGRAVFAIVFAPLGCLARFYISLYLNGRIPSFPLGTFVVNITGTIVLAICWDLQHVPLGGVVGCQVLQGLMDGFCGCLTTVSTWVGELGSLRRSHSYRYGTASVVVALCFLIIIMGSMEWTRGFTTIDCLK